MQAANSSTWIPYDVYADGSVPQYQFELFYRTQLAQSPESFGGRAKAQWHYRGTYQIMQTSLPPLSLADYNKLDSAVSLSLFDF